LLEIIWRNSKPLLYSVTIIEVVLQLTSLVSPLGRHP
jgi:hypothetical protein